MSDDASDVRSDETRPSDSAIEGPDTLVDEDVTDGDSNPPRGHDDQDEWGRIPISQGADQHEEATASESIQTAAPNDTDDTYRPEPNNQVIDSGNVSLENAAFVVLGAIAMVLVMYRLGSVLVV
ncbi:DUF7312 domain-containing protein [Natronosalvus vescus]|uniref:DUF7312 domain-containing protein n=1 Tax=Natronosalvus vescus TaxID=2953881 RepID=UPI0020906661|nr:hypothetical protein [Natronosalvus vescus]